MVYGNTFPDLRQSPFLFASLVARRQWFQFLEPLGRKQQATGET